MYLIMLSLPLLLINIESLIRIYVVCRGGQPSCVIPRNGSLVHVALLFLRFRARQEGLAALDSKAK